MPSFRERERRLAMLEEQAARLPPPLASVEIEPVLVLRLVDEGLISTAPHWDYLFSERVQDDTSILDTRVQRVHPELSYAYLPRLCATLNAEQTTPAQLVGALSPDEVCTVIVFWMRRGSHGLVWDAPGHIRELVRGKPELQPLIARFNRLFGGRIFLPLYHDEVTFFRERVEAGDFYVHAIALGKSDPNSYRRTYQLSVWGKDFTAGSFVARAWTAFLDQEDPSALGRLSTTDLLFWLDEIDRNWGAYTTLPALEEVPDATENL